MSTDIEEASAPLVVKLGGSRLDDLDDAWWDDLAAHGRARPLVLVHGWSKPLKQLDARHRDPAAILRDRYGNQSRWTTPAVIEDILLVNDKGIQSVLKEIDNEELALALKTASEELKQKIFKNMSERAAQLIQEDMQYMGPVRVSDVEQAQQKIVDVVRRLEDAGEIIIAGRGGEKEMVV